MGCLFFFKATKPLVGVRYHLVTQAMGLFNVPCYGSCLRRRGQAEYVVSVTFYFVHFLLNTGHINGNKTIKMRWNQF